MVAKKHSFTVTEIKAGITVLVALVVFVVFIAAMNGLRPPAETHRFYSEFSNIDGLNSGADVRFGGVNVGRVDSVRPSEDDKSLIRIDWNVPLNIPINADCTVYVSQVSIASEKHLEVTTGSKDAESLEDGAFVRKKSGATGMFGALDDIAGSVDCALSKDGVLGDLRALLGVEQTKKSNDLKVVPITKLIGGVDGTVSESMGLIKDLRKMVGEKRESVGLILKKLEDLEDSGVKLLDQLRDMLSENREGVKGTVKNAHRITKKTGEYMDQLVEDLEETNGHLNALLKNTDNIVQNNRLKIETVVSDLQRIMRNLRRFSQIIVDEPEALIRGKYPAGRE